MPMTKKGKEIMGAMKSEYGDKKGEQVFYASKNAGKIGGVDKGFYGHTDAAAMKSSPISHAPGAGMHMAATSSKTSMKSKGGC